MKFNIGDRVRVTDQIKYGNEWFVGKVGVIASIDDGDPFVLFDDRGIEAWFSKLELEYEQ